MPKITPDHIQQLVAASVIHVQKIGEKTCVVCLTLPNGFEITSTASCVDPDDYDEEVGRKIALKRIEDKLWMLEGYIQQVTDFWDAMDLKKDEAQSESAD